MLIDLTDRKHAEEKLAAMHKDLMDASRQAGMAEVATGVLHNVGNVLNSVNVTATILEEQLRKSRIRDVARLVVLLRENSARLPEFLTQDPRGQKVLDFLCQLSEALNTENSQLRSELISLRKNVEHIKDIVAMQQSYAKISGVTESVNVAELVEDALRMNVGALQRHDVQVVRDFAQTPMIQTDKHKILQILVNLIRNAKYACDDSGRTDKTLKLRVVEDEGRIRISVIDNGVGIPAENLTRIFNHGFTTRKEGHGFGLHSGALAAKELGGALIVQSEGHGKGAVFTLELPAGARSANQ
jgi:signal transduction histidine kinase